MGEDIFPVLATIILVATLITFIVAISSYIVFRIKEKKRQEKGEEVDTEAEISETKDVLEAGGSAATPGSPDTSQGPGSVDPALSKPQRVAPGAPSELASAGDAAGVPPKPGAAATGQTPPRVANYAQTPPQSIPEGVESTRPLPKDSGKRRIRSNDPPDDNSHTRRHPGIVEYEPERRRNRRKNDELEFDLSKGRRQTDPRQRKMREEQSSEYSSDGYDDHRRKEQNLSHAQSTFLNFLQGSEDQDDSEYDNGPDLDRDDSREQHFEFRKFNVPRRQSSNRSRPKRDDDTVKWK